MKQGHEPCKDVREKHIMQWNSKFKDPEEAMNWVMLTEVGRKEMM